MSLVHEYFELSKKYTEEYGEKSLVLIQVGSFYEIYTETENDPKMLIATGMLNLRVAKKKLAIQTVCMAGFPDSSVKRFEKILLKNGHTIVYINQDSTQDGKFVRKVFNIVSPGAHLDEYEENESNLGSILVELDDDDDCFVSFSIFDVNKGSIKVFQNIEISRKALKATVYKLCMNNAINELILNFVTNDVSFVNNFEIQFDNYAETFILVHKKVYSTEIAKNSILNQMYQKEALEKYFISYSSLYLDIFDTLNLRNILSCDITNMLRMLEFLEVHDENLISKLAKPIVSKNQGGYLKKINHVDMKLDIFSNNSENLFEILNSTSTSSGKMKLKSILKHPITDCEILKNRYDSVQKIIDTNMIGFLQTHLKTLCNVEKLYRKIRINRFSIDDIKKIFRINKKSKAIIDKLNQIDASFVPSIDTFKKFKKYDSELIDFFVDDFTDFTNEVNGHECSIFKHRNIFRNQKTISKLYDQINAIENEIMKMKDEFDKYVEVKLNINDRFGFYFETTNKRSKELNQIKEIQEFNFNTTKSTVKLTSKRTNELTEIYNTLILKLVHHEREIVVEFFDKSHKIYQESITRTNDSVVWADVFCSIAKNALDNNYVRPSIIDSSASFFEAGDLRHPIIEKKLLNTKKKYIPNDVTLDKSGLILFGVNSVGKSSLMKSVGIATIMAQTGMFVPARYFKFSPFENIAVRIGNQDNIFDAQSSFITEVLEIENIIQNTSNKSLIIADEVCSSTERESALQIITALTKWVSMKKSCFIISSHIFEIVEKLENIKNSKFCYLEVTFDEKEIIFSRKLKYGAPVIRNYGTRIANHIFHEENFKKILQRETTSTKQLPKRIRKSKYNAKKIIENCEICGYMQSTSTDTPIDVHHIQFQCDSINHYNNEDGTKLHDTSNLIALCKKCHIATHKGHIQINGYVENINGMKLDFSIDKSMKY